jgi:hypothetical protein
MTKIEIIEETVEFYSNNPRSLYDLGYTCLYNGVNGGKCAFSRCCTLDSIFKECEGSNEQHEAILLPQYSHIPYNDEFWIDLQGLHDADYNWDGNKLSEIGIKQVNRLKEKYK